MRRHRAGRTGILLLLLSLAMVPVQASAGPYRALRVAGRGSVARLQAQWGPKRFLDILKLNRVDRANALLADTLVLPDAARDLMDLSPWPHRLETLDSVPKVVLVSMRIQAFAAYENGALTRWGPISSGGPRSQSRPGFYTVGWKARMHRSSVDSTWIMPWTVNIDREVGTALHQYSLPGIPASHCCIRLLEEDAMWIYEWVSTWKLSRDGRSVLEPGTPVVLFGAYDYASPPPWRRLAADPAATDLAAEEIASALSFLAESD